MYLWGSIPNLFAAKFVWGRGGATLVYILIDYELSDKITFISNMAFKADLGLGDCVYRLFGIR